MSLKTVVETSHSDCIIERASQYSDQLQLCLQLMLSLSIHPLLLRRIPFSITRMSTTNSLLGLDRKQMEAARLARAAQRQKRSAENDGRTKLNSGRAEKRVRIDRALESAKEHSSDASLSTAVEAGSPPTGIQSKAAQTPATSKPAASTPTTTPPTNASLQYPTGILKRTWAFGHPRSNDIKIEEVLQKNTLNIAVISSWQWDFDWLMSKFVPGKTKYVFVMEGKGESEVGCFIILLVSQSMFPHWEEGLKCCMPMMIGRAYQMC